mmetsp:Transcript_6444/g.13881  ORF Transcript_6444/g.13881 Transcript_6444/m.13881 type:complete len:83 (-) Transcript_6444:6-254(-)
MSLVFGACGGVSSWVVRSNETRFLLLVRGYRFPLQAFFPGSRMPSSPMRTVFVFAGRSVWVAEFVFRCFPAVLAAVLSFRLC